MSSPIASHSGYPPTASIASRRNATLRALGMNVAASTSSASSGRSERRHAGVDRERRYGSVHAHRDVGAGLERLEQAASHSGA